MSNKWKHHGSIIAPPEPERQADLGPTSDVCSHIYHDRESGFLSYSKFLVFSKTVPESGSFILDDSLIYTAFSNCGLFLSHSWAHVSQVFSYFLE